MPYYCKYSGYCPFKHYKRTKKKNEYVQECWNSENCNQASVRKIRVKTDKLSKRRK